MPRATTTCLFLPFLLLISSALSSEQAARVSTGVSVVETWAPNQHLYVRGDLGVPAETLDRLEQWLDENGRNWTVLLTQNSGDEVYRDASGINYRRVDAVEHALVKGLQARTKFGELRDSETNQLNGALFIIYLKERQFSYYGSDHYASNGAPPSQWANGLDSEAKKAMRSGGRIVDAVKNTVTSIDQRVKSTISTRKARRAAQLEKAKQDLATLNQRITEIAEKRAWALSKIDGDGGDIGRLQISELKQKADSLKNSPGTHDLDRLLSTANQWSRLLDQFQAAPKEFEKQQQALQDTKAESDSAQRALERAQSKLENAIQQHQLGNFSYQQSLSDSLNIVSSIAALDRDTRRREELLAARKEAKKQATLREAEKRTLTLKIGGATGACFLGLLGVAGNRRRRRIKTQAEELLASRKLEMQETEDRLFELMDRSAVIVGPFNKLAERGYTGDTLALSRQSLKHIDEAFVLSSNVQKIIEEAEGLIQPSNPLSRFRNLINGGRYENAVDLLDAELNVGLKDVPTLKERARPGEEIDDTFSLPIDAWQERTSKALDGAGRCLDQVETAWSTIVARSEELKGQIKILEGRETEIQVDEWLRCEGTFDEWIPAMAKTCGRAAETGKTDPVHALEGDMAEGDRMANEARQLLDNISSFRTNHWENLEAKEAILDQRKRATVWIDNALLQLGKDAETIASESPDNPTTGLLETFKADLSNLTTRADQAAELIERADDRALPAIKTATATVGTARREIAIALDLAPHDILIEENSNPTDFLHRAKLQHDATLAALDLGEVRSAEEFVRETEELTAFANELVKRSRQIVADYADTSEALWTRRGNLEELGETMIKEVEAMRARYAPRALFIDPDQPGEGTYADSPNELESRLKEITSSLDQAKKRFQEAGLLESWHLLTHGQSLALEGEEICAEVKARSKLLMGMEDGNAETHDSQQRAHEDLKQTVKDRRVTRETLDLHAVIGQKLAEALREIEAGDGKRDPYLVDESLDNLSERLPILRKAITEDLEEHSRALTLLETVKRNQDEATKLWHTADNDRIPNSPETNKSMAGIEKCYAELGDCEKQLQLDHSDWRELQNDLRNIHLRLSESVLSLKRELTLARESVRAIEAATREVRKASRWSGSYGVRITGNYGSRSLAAANDVMQHGLYQEALSMAGQARTRAHQAIASAEAREAAKRRAAEAAKRRRRQAARRSSFSNSSSFGRSSRSGGSSFSSSSRGSSSAGRSSFSSSSGAGRSGW